MDPILANKIAAGEVVERPASVVKELVENAIDAGAHQIEIHLVDSGIQSIHIIDDGSGMSHEDAELAFLRHATSKIQTDMDLFRIQSLGFRGEALPAIASVSRVVMKTGTDNTKPGLELELHGGKKIRENSTTIVGTQLKVSDLFYNTPARLNYLKSLQAELALVTDFVQKIAIAYSSVSFTYTNNGMELLKTRGDGNIKTILSKIFGIKIGESLVRFTGRSTDFEIEGYFARPEHQRYNRNGIYLIVNGRIIRNYSIIKSIVEAFHTYMPDGKYPICYIAITLDPMLLDVNVHPTKQEVRITQERDLAELITRTIREALMEATKPADLSEVFETFNQITSDSDESRSEATFETSKQLPFYKNTLTSAEKEGITMLFQDTFKEKNTAETNLPQSPAPIDTTKISFDQEADTPKTEQIQLDDTTLTHISKKLPTMQIIGQYNGTYIMAQNEDGMYIIDQHAAAERIKYEKYLKQMGDRTFHYQQLTTPILIDLTQGEQQKLEQWREVLEAVGIIYRSFSETSVAIDELPTWIESHKQDGYLRMIFDWLSENGHITREQIIEAAAIMLSCRLSIKANHALTLYEMQSIIDQLELCDNPFTCPHGRPTIILKRLYDFEKWFKRV